MASAMYYRLLVLLLACCLIPAPATAHRAKKNSPVAIVSPHDGETLSNPVKLEFRGHKVKSDAVGVNKHPVKVFVTP